jgi:polyisoprenoid-binding protein YceI
MHDYSLSTTSLTITSTTMSPAPESLLARGTLQALELQIPVDSFTSDKDGLKKQMLKALRADKHPLIIFKLTTYDLESSPNGGVIVKPAGTLTVAGVEQPVDLVLDVREAGGVLQVHGSRDLLMTDFGIKPPTMFMGMLKTNNKVTVKFDLQLTLAPQALASKGL